MANEAKLTITINANGNAAIRVLEETGKKAAAFSKKVQDNWFAISVAAVAAQRVISRAIDFAKASDKYDQNQRSFRLMVQAMGKDAEEEFAKIREASGGLIDNNALTESANRALSLGINIDNIGTLMEVARAKSRDMGITMTQAFNDIVTGIGRGSIMIIDNLGITISIAEANKEYAEALDKTVESLTAQERQQALNNAVMEAGTEAIDRQDLSIRTNSERWQAWEAQINNTKVTIGSFINRAAIGLTGAFQFISAGILVVGNFIGRSMDTFKSIALSVISTVLELANPILEMLTSAARVTDALKLTTGAAEGLKKITADTAKAAEDYKKESVKSAAAAEKTGAAWAAAEELTGQAAANIRTMIEGQEEFNAAQAAAPRARAAEPTEDRNLEERLQLMQEMENRIAEIGLEADMLALFRMDMQHEAELEKLVELNAQKAELAEAELLQTIEREALITEIEQAEINKRLEAQERAAQAEQNIRASVISNAISLLGMFAQESQAAALAAILLSKGQAIAQTIQFGAAAELRAMAELGPIAGEVAAARIRFWTAANVAIIGATGLAQAAGVSSGGGAGGGGGAAAATTPEAPAVPEATGADVQPNIVVQVFNQGSVVTQLDLARDVLDSIEQLQRDGLPADTSR